MILFNAICDIFFTRQIILQYFFILFLIAEFTSLFLTFRHKGIINREVESSERNTDYDEKDCNDRRRYGGHVTPNIALIPALRAEGYDISYIGSYDGIEKRLIEEQNIPYYGIASGKLRRYFDPKNFYRPI